MNTGSSEARRIESIEDNVRTLVNDAEKMGLTPEIRNLLEDFGEYKNRLEKKVQELSIIEAVAMESMDENVVDLREQLFMAVKLIHSDEIAEVIKEYAAREQHVDSGLTFSMGTDFDVKEDGRDTIRKYDVIERMRRYLNKRAEYKKMKELTRKPQPTATGMARGPHPTATGMHGSL